MILRINYCKECGFWREQTIEQTWYTACSPGYSIIQAPDYKSCNLGSLCLTLHKSTHDLIIVSCLILIRYYFVGWRSITGIQLTVTYIEPNSTTRCPFGVICDQNPEPFPTTISFREVYSLWSKEHYTKISKSNKLGYTSAYKNCESLHDMPFSYDICEKDYSQFVDVSQYKDRNPNSFKREPFSEEEFQSLWKISSYNSRS